MKNILSNKSISLYFTLFTALSVLFLPLTSFSAPGEPGTIDTTFNVGMGFNDIVYDLVVDGDDKVVVSGAFTTYNGTTTNRLIRLNTDGTIDTTFNVGTGLNGGGNGLAIDQDGDIYVVGTQFSYNGTATRNGVLRLNSDGTLDTVFSLGNGFSGSLNGTGPQVVQVDSDNKPVIAGAFTTYNGTSSSGIVRLNVDGTIDTTFNVGTGFNNNVYDLDFDSNNKILVAGDFSEYAGSSVNRIVRLNTDGSIDNTFNIGIGFNGQGSSVYVDSSNKVLVGGGFNRYNGTSTATFVRLNTDGSLDQAFAYASTTNSNVMGIDIDESNKILVGGFFSQHNGVNKNFIARLNTDGTLDADFAGSFSSFVRVIELDSNNKIFVGGNFTTTSNGISDTGASANKIVRLNGGTLSGGGCPEGQVLGLEGFCTPASSGSLKYTHPPFCSANINPKTITQGEKATLSWTHNWPTDRTGSYYVRVPGSDGGLFSSSVNSIQISPEHTTRYRLAIFNLWGANFCEVEIKVVDQEGIEITAPRNKSFLSASASKNPLLRTILSFFSKIFIK